jgi:hypothetical protein
VNQRHLTHEDTVNYGSYYTPEWIVDVVYAFIRKNVSHWADYTVLDTSCGYGGFMRSAKGIGADIDARAVQTAQAQFPDNAFFQQNSLFNISRAQYRLDKQSKIIVVGNPPYNDATSIIRNNIKQIKFERDADVFSRDVGISFLLSYDKICADYVCVLHPLSYLIKKANFESLGSFRQNYKLTDSALISSGVFSDTSKSTHFPIIIAFYERNALGMDYDYIKNYTFSTQDGKGMALNQYDGIGNYVDKYPNRKKTKKEEAVAYFYTMRDINALKRTATFLQNENDNTVRVTKDVLPYYCYVDIFKDYIPHIPYYFGNSDIMIDNDGFIELKDVFIARSIQKHPRLNDALGRHGKHTEVSAQLDGYFKMLLGEHYVD